jgi:hypothetical protein
VIDVEPLSVQVTPPSTTVAPAPVGHVGSLEPVIPVVMRVDAVEVTVLRAVGREHPIPSASVSLARQVMQPFVAFAPCAKA